MHRYIALANRLRRHLAPERGLALIAALGATTSLAVLGTTVVAVSTGNYGASSRAKADNAAFALAEAGVNDAAAVLNGAADSTNPLLLPPRTSTYDTGSVTWSGSLDVVSSVWTVTATGEVRNPTGVSATPARRTLTARISLGGGSSSTIQPLSNEAWNYVVATRTGNACDETLANSVTWSARLYVAGNLCLSTGSTVNAGPLDVKGQINLTAVDASVGSSSSAVSEVHAGVGCKYTSGVVHSPCSSADHVYAAVSDSATPVLTPPAADWDRWYANASPGPKSACTSSSGSVPVFDNDGVRNNSVSTAFDLTPANSYSCTTASGQLSWDAPTHVLTVRGTVFVDGSIKAGDAVANTYLGQGVVYTSGAFEISANTRLCALVVAGDCDFSNWNPDSSFLAVVANGNGGGNVLLGYSIAVGSSGRFQGALYGTYALTFGSSSKVQGPIVVSYFSPCSTLQMPSFPFLRNVPSGLPGQPLSARRPSAPYGFS